MQHLAIIGGGAAGTLAAIHALRTARTPATLYWFEGSGTFARGLAYSTTDRLHLLNVRADRMGAFPSDIGGFYQWLALHHPGLYAPEDYAPRHLYGDYLQQILADATEQKSAISLRRHASTVTRIEPTAQGALILHPERLAPITVSRLVLATGNEAPAVPSAINHCLDHPAFIANPWQPPSGSVLTAAPDTLEGRVAILGSGLTAVDIASSLLQRQPRTRLTLISRHALLPQPHSYLSDPVAPPALPETLPTSPSGWCHLIRQQVREHTSHGGNWRTIIDALRPITPAAWHSLSSADQSRAHRHALTYWNIHRHRCAPAIHTRLADALAERRLHLIAGHLQPPVIQGAQLALTIRHRSAAFELLADALILATGPEQRLARSANPLLRQLFADTLLQPGGAGLGAATTSSGTAAGSAPDCIYPMGTLIAGDWLESTAMPELRVQAQQAAHWLTR